MSKRRKWGIWLLFAVGGLIVASFLLGGGEERHEIAPGVFATIAWNPMRTRVTVSNESSKLIEISSPEGEIGLAMSLDRGLRRVVDFISYDRRAVAVAPVRRCEGGAP